MNYFKYIYSRIIKILFFSAFFLANNLFALPKCLIDYNFFQANDDSIILNDDWNWKIKLYNKTKNKYFQTIVCENPNEAFSFILKENDNGRFHMLNTKINEVLVNKNTDLMYSINENNSGFTILNTNSNIGLKINYFIQQKLTNNLFFFNNGSLIYDAYNTSYVFAKLPRYNFNFNTTDFCFNNRSFFPYLRLTFAHDLYDCNPNLRGSNFNDVYVKPNINEIKSNSDLIFSLITNKLFVGPKKVGPGNCSFNIETSNSNSIIKVQDDFYSRFNFDIIDNPILKQKLYYNNGKELIYSSPNYYSFNDSNIAFYDKHNFEVSIFNFFYNNQNKVIKSKYFDRIGYVKFFELDKTSNYLYLEYEPPFNTYFYNTSRYYYGKHPNELMVINCITNNVVYIGPSLNIDYTCDKVGYIMTMANSFQLEDSLVTKVKNNEVSFEKYGLLWDYTNTISSDLNKRGTYASPIEYKFVWKRYLVNLFELFNEEFENCIDSLAEININKNDFFADNNKNEFKKNHLIDSLIWNSYKFNHHKSVSKNLIYKNNFLIDDSVFNFYYSINKLDYNGKNTEKETNNYNESIKLSFSDVKKHVTSNTTYFIFEFKSDYLSQNFISMINSFNLLHVHIPFSDDPLEKDFIYKNGNNDGLIKLDPSFDQSIYLKTQKFYRSQFIHDNFGYYYKYSIVSNDADIAKNIFEQLSVNKNFSLTFEFNKKFDENSIVNSSEFNLLNNVSIFSNIDNNHYALKYYNQINKSSDFKTTYSIYGNDKGNLINNYIPNDSFNFSSIVVNDIL